MLVLITTGAAISFIDIRLWCRVQCVPHIPLLLSWSWCCQWSGKASCPLHFRRHCQATWKTGHNIVSSMLVDPSEHISCLKRPLGGILLGRCQATLPQLYQPLQAELQTAWRLLLATTNGAVAVSFCSTLRRDPAAEQLCCTESPAPGRTSNSQCRPCSSARTCARARQWSSPAPAHNA